MRQREQHRARWALGTVAFAATVLFSMPSAQAEDGTAYVLSDVQCDPNFNGVLDLTLVNEQPSQAAMFVISPAGGSLSSGGSVSSISVAAASVGAITLTDLADGMLVVPVSVDGVDSTVAVQVACDAPEVAVLGAPTRSQSLAPALPQTGSSSTGGLVIGSALVAAGIAASLVSRRRCS